MGSQQPGRELQHGSTLCPAEERMKRCLELIGKHCIGQGDKPQAPLPGSAPPPITAKGKLYQQRIQGRADGDQLR